jgi:glycerophosphoryl diester phosphodiesterase
MPHRRASDGRRGAFFDAPLPRIFAHRGLADGVTENTLAAFAKAVEAGADYLETDVHASSDGIAMVSHDSTLERVAGLPEQVLNLTAAQLGRVDLGHGAGFVPLEDALRAFPDARFNIDVKSLDAALPTARAIVAAGAHDRVLITSFSQKRRRAAVDALDAGRTASAAPVSTAPVAASAAAPEFVAALIWAKLGFVALVRLALRRVDAVQIPTTVGPFTATTPRVIRALHAAGVEVHVWTINDLDRARRLLEMGVDGIITDRADLMLPLAASFR